MHPTLDSPKLQCSTTPEFDAFPLQYEGKEKVSKDDAMDVEVRPLIFIPFSTSLAELCDYDSDHDYSSSSSSCHCPSTPPARKITPEQTNPSTARRIGGPTIEEQQESDRAYVESEPIRTSPRRPLKRQARIYVASTSSSASPPEIKKLAEDELEPVGYILRKKRAREEEYDDEYDRNDSFEDLRKTKKVKFADASDKKDTPVFGSQTTGRPVRPRRHRQRRSTTSFSDGRKAGVNTY